MRRAVRAPLLLLLLSVACAERPSWPPEVNVIDGLALDESSIVSTLEGTNVRVSLPLRATRDGARAGKIRLALLDVSGERDDVVGEATRRFDLAGGSERFELTLPGLDAGLTREALARYVIRYEIRCGGESIHGRRDLWVTLPKAELVLLAPSELAAGRSTWARVFAREPASRAPLAGAKVTVRFVDSDGESAPLGSAMTDAAGQARVALDAPDHLAEGTLVATLDAGALSAEVQVPLAITRAQTVLLSTDKPRYQPGQTVHLRALVLDTETRMPAAGEEVVFEALDAKGNKIFREAHTADAYGIAATRLPLASELNFGAWTLRATALGSTAQRSIEVARYALPKFQVTLETGRDHYQPGERVQGTLQATYFFGAPVEGAVHLEGQIDDGSGLRTVTQIDGRLTGGAFGFEVEIPATLDPARVRSFILAARVTDSASQVVDTQRALPLASGDLVVVAYPEHPPIRGLPTPLLIAVTDPAGAPVAATVRAGLLGQVRVGEGGIATLDLPAQAEALALTLVAEAADGRTGRTSLQLPAPAERGLVVRTDRSVYRSGERAVVEILSAGAPRVVALDLGQGGRALSLQEVPLTRGHARIELTLEAGRSGALTIEASFPGDGGKMIRASRTLFVDADDALDVEVTAPSRTAPGETAEVRVQVRDPSGAGVPAAVGLAIVDPAVFALGGSAPGDEATRLAFGTNLPPPVAGHTVEEILSPDPVRRAAAARLLFAAGPDASAFGFEVNSYREELGGVRTIAEVRFARTATDLIERLQRAGERGVFTEENAERYARSVVEHTADAYGQPLRFDAGDGWTYAFESAGPDEVFGSPDDQRREVELWQLLYGGGRRGGWELGAEEDAAAGPPQAGAPISEPDGNGPGAGSPATQVRSYFPETLLVMPALLTDSSGQASVPVRAADSITTWKIAASASTLDGRVGAGQGDLAVFQDFFVDLTLPPVLTREDEVEVPIAVYNQLDHDLQVHLSVQPEGWFELLSAGSTSLTVPAGSVRGVPFRIRALGVGVHGLTVSATAGGVQDAARRTVLVEPGGEAVDTGFSGRIEPGSVQGTVSFPATAIPGGNRLAVKITPGVMAQTVDGMDAILAEPHGCFEQSTSTTWPNVMVAAYMRKSGTGTPEVLDRAVTLVQKGYQMLVGYEAPGGGFNWWGDDTPGNKILTAIGILILRDMEQVIEIDASLVDRSATWLAKQQRADGSWPEGDALHMGNEFLSEDPAIVTAFAVEALEAAGGHDDAVRRGLGYLEGRLSGGIEAPFTLAAVTRTLARAGSPRASAALAALYDTASVSPEGRYHWNGPSNHSWSGASGTSAGIETTAVATQAFLAAGAHPDAIDGALAYLTEHKDSLGTWSQTQATVQALRAFTAALESTGAEDVRGRIEVRVDGALAATLDVDPLTADLVRTVDLSGLATAGDHRVGLTFSGQGRLMFQVVAVHHLPWRTARAAGGVAVEVQHGRTQLGAGEVDPVQVLVTNTTPNDADQILVKVGLAPGMAPVASDLEGLVREGKISRFERSESGVVLYVPRLAAGATETFAFGAVPSLAGDLEAPATLAYGYYNPQEKAVAPPVAFTVLP